ncbi:MAG TPA: ABC transporter permease, partial [Candidatus Nanoarchaeia archaeon]
PFMRRFAESANNTPTAANLKLDITFNYLILLLGAGVAILGSVVAGALAAFKASRMKPQEALRQL